MKSSFAFAVGWTVAAACSNNPSGPPPVAAGVVISPSAPWIKIGASVQLEATVLDSGGHPIAGRAVTFQSTDNSIVAVTPSGRASAVGPLGSALVIAQSIGTKDTVTGFATVGVFDTSIVARVSLAARPYSVAVSATNDAYVSQTDLNQLARVNLSTMAVVESVKVGITPTEITFNSTGTRAYVTNQFSDNVSVINVATNAVVGGYSVAGNPFAIIVAPGDTIIYVTTTADSVLALRASNGTEAAGFQIPIISNGFAVHDSLLYVSTRDVGTVTVINLKTNTLLDTIPVGGRPQGIVVSPDGKELYVANELAQLQFWNIVGDSLDASVALAGGGFGLARSPANGRLYVTTFGGGKVQVLDPVSRTIVKSFPTQGVARRIAFSASGSVAIVANEAGWIDFIR